MLTIKCPCWFVSSTVCFFVTSAGLCVSILSGWQQQQLGGVRQEFGDRVNAHEGQRHSQGADRGDAAVRGTLAFPQDQSAEVPATHGSGGHPARPR